MFKILQSGTIKVIQGDNGIFDFAINGYELKEGDKVYFTVKADYGSSSLICKEVTEFEDGKAKFMLTSDDTNIPVGVYLYDIQCNLSDGRVDTIIKPTKFQVLGGITNV